MKERVHPTFPWLLATALCTHACVSKLDDLTSARVNQDEPSTAETTGESTTNEVSSELSATTSMGSEPQAPKDAGIDPNTDPPPTADAESPSDSPEDTSTTATSSADETFDADVTSAATTSTGTSTSVAAATSEPATGTTAADASTNDPNGDTPQFFTSDSGLLVWFDADHDASFDVEAETVQSWLDRSGNAFNLTQTAAGNRPQRVTDALASRAVVRFDGTDDSLTTTQILQNRAFEVLIVWRTAVAPGLTKSSLLVNGRNFEINYSHTTPAAANATSVCVGVNCVNDSGWHNARFSPTPQAQVAYLWNPVFAETGTDLVAQVWGGTAITQSDPDDTPVLPNAPLLVGNCAEGSCPFNGDIAEFLVFDRALSTSERTRAETYLALKWALPG